MNYNEFDKFLYLKGCVFMPQLKELFLIKVPHVDRKDAYTSLVLPHYEFYTALVEDYEMALAEGTRIIEEKGIHAVILCAGFDNIEFGKLSQKFGPNVGVFVASGDTRSNHIVSKAIQMANW